VAKGCLESAAASGQQENREIQKIKDEECLHRLNHPAWFGYFIDNISK